MRVVDNKAAIFGQLIITWKLRWQWPVSTFNVS